LRRGGHATRLFLERVRNRLIAKEISNTLCTKSAKSEERAREANGGTPSPRFFVSVASKGVIFSVSLLFATLARGSIGVAAKGLKGARRWREGNALGWGDLGGV
jgi:hypothetical protein